MECPSRHPQEPSIRTSKPNHIVLFVESSDLPSQVALKNLDNALEGTAYRCYSAVLEKKYHPAVCISYNVTEFPTLLVLDNSAQVLHRETVVRNMTEDKFRTLLQRIASYRTTNL